MTPPYNKIHIVVGRELYEFGTGAIFFFSINHLLDFTIYTKKACVNARLLRN